MRCGSVSRLSSRYRDGLINYEVKVKGSSAKIQVDAAFTEALQPFPEEVRRE